MSDVNKNMTITVTGNVDQAVDAFSRLAKEQGAIVEEQKKLEKEQRDYNAALKQFGEEEKRAEKLAKEYASAMRDLAAQQDSTGSTLLILNQGYQLFAGVASTVFSALSTVARAGYDVAASLAASASQIEQTKTRFETLFGEGRVADRAIAWAREFGKTTPLTLDEVTSRMAKLKSAGFDPLDDSLGIMRKLGDTTAALGVDFDRLLNPLRKLNSGGKATFESINQFAEAGIPIYDILRDKMGLTADAVQDIAKANIRGSEVSRVVIEALGEQYEGAMNKLSNTAEGAFSTVLDLVNDIKISIAERGAWDELKGFVIGVRDSLTEFVGSKSFEDFADAFGGSLAIGARMFVDVTKALAGQLSDMLPTISEAVRGFNALFDPRKANTFFQFLTGDDVVEKSEKQIAEFQTFYVQRMEEIKEAKERALGLLVDEEDFLDMTEQAEETKTVWVEGIDNIVKKLKELENEQKKIDKEDKKRRDKLKKELETEGKERARLAQIAIKEQKTQETAALKQYEESMTETIKTRFEQELDWYKKRTDAAIKSYNDEVSAARKARQRISEDRMTTLNRDLSDTFESIKRKTENFGNAPWSDEEKAFLRGAGEEGIAFSSRGFGLREDQEKRLRRYMEDRMRDEKRKEEDLEAERKKNEEDRLKRMVEAQKEGIRELQKAQIQAMKNLKDQIEKMKINIDHRLTIKDTKKFVQGFISTVFERAGVVANAEGVIMAGV